MADSVAGIPSSPDPFSPVPATVLISPEFLSINLMDGLNLWHIYTLPFLSTCTAYISSIEASLAFPPSPECPWLPLPAKFVIIPIIVIIYSKPFYRFI